jgi:D-tyrosyl-tRNA(Tyr) deacylase|tara:strand:- start:532 stop:984 length:453 start_codon:yes stop_codon:yes gene_type:complete
MRVVIQKVKRASVKVNNQIISEIKYGLMILVGYELDDTIEDITWLVNKIINLRIFNDHNNKMNLSLKDTDGDILVVSQFTLHASTKKGNRPSFINSLNPAEANQMYNITIKELEKSLEKKIKCGVFGELMDVELINNGPLTITIDSKKKE